MTLRTSVQRIGSRQGESAKGAARSHSCPKWSIDQARLDRVVAGHQHVPGAERSAALQHGQEVGHLALRRQSQDLDVEHADAGAGTHLLQLARHRRVADSGPNRLVQRGRQQPQADMRIARVGGAAHHLDR